MLASWEFDVLLIGAHVAGSAVEQEDQVDIAEDFCVLNVNVIRIIIHLSDVLIILLVDKTRWK